MPQGPLSVGGFANPSGVVVQPKTDASSNLIVSGIGGTASALSIGSKRVIKSTAGIVVCVNVLVAGAVGSVNDTNSTALIATANEVAVIPAAVGQVVLEFPCLTGIAVSPGAGQVISVSYQ